MKMNQLEAMSEARLLQHLTRGDKIGGVETELRVLAAARRPFTVTFAVQSHANSNHRLDADFFCRTNGLLKLFEFLDDDDDQFSEFATEQRNPNEGFVLVTVANDQTLRVLVHRERGDQFRFAAGFESEVKL